MGNKDSKHGGASETSTSERRHGRAAELEAAYQRWTEHLGGVNEPTLERIFGPMLGKKLWRYLKDGMEEGDPRNASLKAFESRLAPLLFGSSIDVWLRMLAGEGGLYHKSDITELIHICRACSGVEFSERTDEKTISAIIAAVTSGEEASVDQLGSWIENTSPRLMASLQKTVTTGIQTATTQCDKWIGPSSKLLSAMNIWLIQCCVPSYLIRLEASPSSAHFSDPASTSYVVWDLLYSSDEDGLSANRFENKVFNYRSPTVTVVEDQNCDRYCLCVDEEWRCSTQRWGTSGCWVYRLHPRWELVESGGAGGMILFNLKQRGLPQGLFVGSNPKKPVFSINADFSNARSIEVWGCGSRDSYLAQQNHRQWEKRQVEKNLKVPLPGNWEDSPDRMLLEMGGIRTQHAEK